MTATITQLISTVTYYDVGSQLQNGLGFIVTVALIVLLVQKELIHAYGGQRSREWIRALNLGIAPLTFAFLLTVVFHLLNALGRPH